MLDAEHDERNAAVAFGAASGERSRQGRHSRKITQTMFAKNMAQTFAGAV